MRDLRTMMADQCVIVTAMPCTVSCANEATSAASREPLRPFTTFGANKVSREPNSPFFITQVRFFAFPLPEMPPMGVTYLVEQGTRPGLNAALAWSAGALIRWPIERSSI